MPGMMDTVLNLGMNDEIVEGFARQTGNKWAAWDSYRRFIQMYGDVVMDLKPENKDDIDPFEAIIEEVKEKRGIYLDTDLTVDDLRDLTVHSLRNRPVKTSLPIRTNNYGVPSLRYSTAG